MTAVSLPSPRALLAAIAVASVLLTVRLVSPSDTKAARGMELALQDDGDLPGSAASACRAGFRSRQADLASRGCARWNLLWAYTMPPRVQRAAQSRWQVSYAFDSFDSLATAAAESGIRIHLSVIGSGAKAGRALKSSIKQAWYKPNTRSSASSPVSRRPPRRRVDRYSIWNEPNWTCSAR